MNKVIIIGNLGNDPETKYTPSGVCVCSISVATTRKWKDKQGVKQEETEWHRVTLWDKLGEIAGEYLKKGKKVCIEGRLKTDKYTDANGVEKYSTKIIASDMEMLGDAPSRDGGGERQQRSESTPRRDTKPEGAPAKSNDFADDFADDDIPF